MMEDERWKKRMSLYICIIRRKGGARKINFLFQLLQCMYVLYITYNNYNTCIYIYNTKYVHVYDGAKS